MHMCEVYHTRHHAAKHEKYMVSYTPQECIQNTRVVECTPPYVNVPLMMTAAQLAKGLTSFEFVFG